MQVFSFDICHSIIQHQDKLHIQENYTIIIISNMINLITGWKGVGVGCSSVSYGGKLRGIKLSQITSFDNHQRKFLHEMPRNFSPMKVSRYTVCMAEQLSTHKHNTDI